MRSGLARTLRAASLGLGILGAAALPTRGQVPVPEVPELHKRSGLITRFASPETFLPPDPRRDTFYDTRFADNVPFTKHPNVFKNGGLYGLYWRTQCGASVYPYFYGAPGQSTIGPDCRPWWRPLRVVQGIVQPFRPVGMYYDQGSYVPVHDLDPLVPGPGSYPIPIYPAYPRGG